MFVYSRYSQSDVATVARLIESGLSDYAIAAKCSMPRSTVQGWRRRRAHPQRRRTRRWPADAASYSYLLGIYLGDGHVVCGPGAACRLDVYLDAAHLNVIDEVERSILRCYPETRVRRNPRPGAVRLSSSVVDWTAAFPQHGRGRKHTRPIELATWQRSITHRHPEQLLRGLIHSDGCRCVNRFHTNLPSGRSATYAYPRYFFSNLSPDIRGIFAEHCDLLGIRWTQSNHRNLSVSHRASVEALDGFIGPKS